MGLNVRLLQDSFGLVIEREPNLTHRFYGILFSRYPQARPLFGRHSQEQQEKMLTEALAAVIDHLEDAPWIEEKLMAMGAKHVDYQVTDAMYPWVADAMITAISQVAGAAWTPEHQQAWTDALNAIAGLMMRGAKAHSAGHGASPASPKARAEA